MSSDREPLRKAGDDHLHPSAVHLPESEIHLGGTTADAVRLSKKDKPVSLEVNIPKSVRRSVRDEAARRGLTVDEVVLEALQSRTVR